MKWNINMNWQEKVWNVKEVQRLKAAYITRSLAFSLLHILARLIYSIKTGSISFWKINIRTLNDFIAKAYSNWYQRPNRFSVEYHPG